MTNGQYIYIGAKPNLKDNHPGGQSTASLGLIDFCKRNRITLEIIDSAQESFPPPSMPQRVRRALNRQLILLKKLFGSRYDGVIIFCGEGVSFFEKTLSALICRFFRTETVLSVRSGFFISDCERSLAMRKLSGWLLRIPNHIAAQGSTWINFYVSLGVATERIVLIRNWLSLGRTITSASKLVTPESGGKVTFMFLGWLVKEKGANELMAAIRSSATLRDCRVIFAGDGNLYESFCILQRQEQLNNIELLGWQTPEQVDELLEQAHVFVLPTYAEGFPNALLEALSKGLPAIISPVGGIPDSAIDGENAIWVQPRDVDGLRTAMETFANNPALVAQYSLKSIEIANANHDQEVNLRRLFKCFKRSPQFDKRVERLSD